MSRRIHSIKPMPRTSHSPGPSAGSRKKRQFKHSTPGTIAAAVSMPEPLYRQALRVADSCEEGNFSRYVRNLIRADLAAAQ
jgi:hypothetical protein